MAQCLSFLALFQDKYGALQPTKPGIPGSLADADGLAQGDAVREVADAERLVEHQVCRTVQMT